MKYKSISIIAIFTMMIGLLGFTVPAHATLTPQWDVSGTYVWTVLGTYNHDITLTQNPDGSFTGTGGYPAGSAPYTGLGQTTETITNGQVTGDTITFTTTYNGPYNPGYSVTVSGTIAADGTISGTSPWSWAMTSGHANLNVITDWGDELSASVCADRVGGPVVNVTEKVINDVDSGLGGNNWAFDNYNRHIQVWQTGSKQSTEYCALVTYEGKANAQAGQTSPGNDGPISTDVTAIMKGGYSANINGSFSPNGYWKTKGSVGTVDYQCSDIDGTDCYPVSWVTKYFSSSSFSYNWWGWFYHTSNNGSWVNSSEGTFGDIK